MLAVGILGAPFIGYLQETSATRQLEAMNPALYQTVTVEKSYLPGKCQAIDPVKSAAVTDPAAQLERTHVRCYLFSKVSVYD